MTLKEAEVNRVMTICNACRYCEGFCAVFPAMELRRTFSGQDLRYLANLCHNCRGCYYACQYAPPHEFMLNLPRALGELRQETYLMSCRPGPMKGVFRNNGRIVALITVLAVISFVLLTRLLQDGEVLFASHTGDGAFYRVIPYAAMVIPFSVVALLVLAGLWQGFAGLWRHVGGTSRELKRWPAHFRAVRDVLALKYLDGGGHGCNYPDDRFSMVRRNFHHALFYGFLLCLASTTSAFFYDHLLHRPAPYPFWSWPVFLGTLGGLALLAGTGGMLFLKWKMDRTPAARETMGMDIVFSLLLLFTSLTGLLLLLLRATPAMGTLLAFHLGFVLALFITLPYGKFVHGVYRYAALVRNAAEQSREERKT
jgi:citrate/tricarballylate utilization protein